VVGRNINDHNRNGLFSTHTQMLAACGSFTSGKAPTRRWQDDPPVMQFLRSL
jgi:hypothetical protein